MEKKYRIMFVCHGNICRSPMAEFILKKMLRDRGLEGDFYVASSATSTEEIYNGQGNPVYPPARKELAAHGISADGKCAVQLKEADYTKYDLFLLMDDNNLRNIKRIFKDDFDPEGKVWKLLDFVEGGIALAQCEFSELSALSAHRFSGKDISDPWYSGDFRRTYEDIFMGCEGLLKVLVSRC